MGCVSKFSGFAWGAVRKPRRLAFALIPAQRPMLSSILDVVPASDLATKSQMQYHPVRPALLQEIQPISYWVELQPSSLRLEQQRSLRCRCRSSTALALA